MLYLDAMLNVMCLPQTVRRRKYGSYARAEFNSTLFMVYMARKNGRVEDVG